MKFEMLLTIFNLICSLSSSFFRSLISNQKPWIFYSVLFFCSKHWTRTVLLLPLCFYELLHELSKINILIFFISLYCIQQSRTTPFYFFLSKSWSKCFDPLYTSLLWKQIFSSYQGISVLNCFQSDIPSSCTINQSTFLN